MCWASQAGCLGDTGRWKSLWPDHFESATRTPALEPEDLETQNACAFQEKTPSIGSRVEFLLKTESGYLRDAGVT